MVRFTANMMPGTSLERARTKHRQETYTRTYIRTNNISHIGRQVDVWKPFWNSRCAETEEDGLLVHFLGAPLHERLVHRPQVSKCRLESFSETAA